MAPDGYLHQVLADGARRIEHRSGIRELLGVPEEGAEIVFPAVPRGGFVYRRTADVPGFARAAAETGWQVQVVDDPSDPWLGDTPPAPARSDRASRPAALVPLVQSTAGAAAP